MKTAAANQPAPGERGLIRIRSLNQLLALRSVIAAVRRRWLIGWHGVAVDRRSSISLSARFVAVAPGAIRIGADSLVAFKTLLLTDRDDEGAVRPIVVGERCFVGGGAMILPGVTIGDEAIIAAGAVVTQDVPPRTIVGGNPARIIRRHIVVGRFGRLAGADDNSRRLWRP